MMALEKRIAHLKTMLMRLNEVFNTCYYSVFIQEIAII